VPDFAPYEKAFAQWDFQCGDFEALKLMPDDFIYADPPYADVADGYNERPFTWADQVRLARWLARHPGPVIASGQGGRTAELYRGLGFTVETVQMPRSINSDGAGRGSVDEILAKRNLK
jgi:DNA adenine methylase